MNAEKDRQRYGPNHAAVRDHLSQVQAADELTALLVVAARPLRRQALTASYPVCKRAAQEHQLADAWNDAYRDSWLVWPHWHDAEVSAAAGIAADAAQALVVSQPVVSADPQAQTLSEHVQALTLPWRRALTARAELDRLALADPDVPRTAVALLREGWHGDLRRPAGRAHRAAAPRSGVATTPRAPHPP